MQLSDRRHYLSDCQKNPLFAKENESTRVPEYREIFLGVVNEMQLSDRNRLLHRKSAIRVFIHESQIFRNKRVSVVSEVLQRVNKIRTKHFLWCNLFVIYIRPISCNKPLNRILSLYFTR